MAAIEGDMIMQRVVIILLTCFNLLLSANANNQLNKQSLFYQEEEVKKLIRIVDFLHSNENREVDLLAIDDSFATAEQVSLRFFLSSVNFFAEDKFTIWLTVSLTCGEKQVKQVISMADFTTRVIQENIDEDDMIGKIAINSLYRDRVEFVLLSDNSKIVAIIQDYLLQGKNTAMINAEIKDGFAKVYFTLAANQSFILEDSVIIREGR